MIYLSNEIFWKRTGGSNGSLEIEILKMLEFQLQETDFGISEKQRKLCRIYVFFLKKKILYW